MHCIVLSPNSCLQQGQLCKQNLQQCFTWSSASLMTCMRTALAHNANVHKTDHAAAAMGSKAQLPHVLLIRHQLSQQAALKLRTAIDLDCTNYVQGKPVTKLLVIISFAKDRPCLLDCMCSLYPHACTIFTAAHDVFMQGFAWMQRLYSALLPVLSMRQPLHQHD